MYIISGIRMTEYTIIIHPAEEGGYWVEVPILPGCYSQGKSIDEAMRNIKEAIELHIEGLMEDNEPVPVEDDLIIGRIQVTHIEDHLDVMVSSHPHTDHIGGKFDGINAIPVKLFVDNGATHTAPAYKDLMKTLVQKQTLYPSAKKWRYYILY